MLKRRLLTGLLVLAAGCAHRRLPRLPTAADVAELNDLAAGDPAGIRIYYRDATPCGPGPWPCPVESLGSVRGASPVQVRRILSADERRLTVVAASGEVWVLDMSKVAGASTQPAKPVRGALVGGVFGLVLGGLVALSIGVLSEPGPDAPVDAGPAHPLPAAAMIGSIVGFTVAGAVVGALVDHRFPTVERFYFDEDSDPSALRR